MWLTPSFTASPGSPFTAAVNPRENRLTEATAAVLEQVDGLALDFARSLLDAGIEDAHRRELGAEAVVERAQLRAVLDALVSPRVDVVTQLATPAGRFVDLELLLRPPVGAEGSGLLLWVEVKHGADLHGDQLDAYLKQIEGRPLPEDVRRAVILLAPREWMPEDGSVSPKALRAGWQDFAAAVKVLAAGPAGAAQDWLLHEYIRYLEEEGLSDPDALTAVSALALMEYRTARDAAAGLCEHVDAAVQAWGPRHDHQKTRGKTPVPAYGLDYWATYDAHRLGQPVAAEWRGGWFEWGLRDTTKMQNLDGARGAWAFVAGVTFESDSPMKADGNEAWLTRQTVNGFVRFWEGYWRLARLRYPDELLKDTTLEDQGRAVGDW